jgi:Protein of unknown function (DUF3302)
MRLPAIAGAVPDAVLAGLPLNACCRHAAGWVSLFTLHALWPFLWIWAMAYRPEHGWGVSESQPGDQSTATVSNGFDDGTIIELVHDPRQHRTLLAQFNGGRWTLLRHVNVGASLQLIPFSFGRRGNPRRKIPRPRGNCSKAKRESRMAAASAISTTKLASIPGAFSKAKNRPICRSSRLRKLISSSISRPPRRSALPSLRRCWPPPTR